jgi:hypothetical protein
MLNPQYEVPYRLVGATKIHSEAGILVGSFLTSIEYPEISSLMPIGRADLVAFEVRVAVDSVVAGQSIAEIFRGPDFPSRCVFIGVESEAGEVELPTGATRLRGGETLILAAHRPDLPQILRALTGRSEGALPPEREQLVEVLAQVSFFSGLSREDLAELAAAAQLEKRPAGETLFRAGDPGDRLFVLRHGAVELEPTAGRKRRLRAPAHFGEREAVTGEPRAQTARVAESAELLTLQASAFRAALLKNPFLGLELGKRLFTPPREEP